MKYSFTSSALIALAYGSVVILAAVLPESRNPKTSHVINVTRDIKNFNAAAGKQRLGRRDSSSIEDSLTYNGYWIADGTAGGLNVQVTLDTGSADLWLVSPNAGSDATSGVETWDPSTASGTTVMSGYTFDISYGAGNNGVSGSVYQSPVCLGSACVTMAVGSATHDQGMGNAFHSGIMGLAFQGGNSVSPNKQPTFMEVLAPQLSQPIMTTKFSPGTGPSQIAFGEIGFDYVAPLQQISIDTQKYPYSWSFLDVQYNVDGQNIGSFDIVFDTGCPNTTGDESTVRAYYSRVSGAVDEHGDATSWSVPCGTQLPDLTLNLGNALLVIPGERLYNGNTATSGQCAVWFVKDGSATRGCVGDPFFSQHVVVYDFDAQTVQWGNQS